MTYAFYQPTTTEVRLGMDEPHLAWSVQRYVRTRSL